MKLDFWINLAALIFGVVMFGLWGVVIFHFVVKYW
jgi:hypothetical protein